MKICFFFKGGREIPWCAKEDSEAEYQWRKLAGSSPGFGRYWGLQGERPFRIILLTYSKLVPNILFESLRYLSRRFSYDTLRFISAEPGSS